MTDLENPSPTVDIIIEVDDQLVLVERRNEPCGWALPGGFIDRGETVEYAATREAREETSLEVQLQEMLYVYSNPARDPRQHTMTTVFIATADGRPRGADDARRARLFSPDAVPREIAFDHRRILDDYLTFRATGGRPSPAAELQSFLERRGQR